MSNLEEKITRLEKNLKSLESKINSLLDYEKRASEEKANQDTIINNNFEILNKKINLIDEKVSALDKNTNQSFKGVKEQANKNFEEVSFKEQQKRAQEVLEKEVLPEMKRYEKYLEEKSHDYKQVLTSAQKAYINCSPLL